MALRLIDTTQPSSHVAAAPDAEIVTRAHAALSSRDFEAYRRCATDAAAVTDRDRGYLARRSVVEAALQPRPGESAAGTATRLRAAAESALDVLEPGPSEPVLLNLAGVALYELGALRGAEALFGAVRRLDPGHEHLARNLRELKKRRRSGVRVRLPQPVAAALPALERRARRLADAAQPGEPQPISLCMIVRDEERVLDRCLASVAGVVDEIVVVDTGSTDRTVEIARAHGARVIEHPWAEHFAEARNVGLDAATSEWILHLDADEALFPEDVDKLRVLTRRTWREAYSLQVHNRVGTERSFEVVVSEATRLFRRAHRFHGRVHETVALPMVAQAPERVEAVEIRLDHDGYLHRTKVEKDKQHRNLSLLERQLREERETPFVHFNIGTEHAGAGRLDRALEHFSRAWTLLLADPAPTRQPFAPPLASRYADALRMAGRVPEALAVIDRGLELFPGLTDLIFSRSFAVRSQGDLDEAERLLRQCLAQGDAPTRYVRRVGTGSFLAAAALAGLRLERGDAAEAEALLRQALADDPQVTSTIDALATTMLRRGAAADELLETVEDLAAPLRPDGRFALAAALHGAGHVAPAEEQLRLVLDAEPDNEAARVALVETLLSQSRWAEAAGTAGVVPPQSIWAPLAAVSEVFAAIAGGDHAAASVGLERAAAAGTPDFERELLTAWARAAAGGPPADERLPRAALPLLLTSLEALLRVHEFDAFASLVALAELVDLPTRARREALATMYLRRGFLDSAAEEWAAACDDDGPDARALSGLAQVAAARGAADDARVFAEAALELDPGAPAAELVLASLSG